MITTGSDFDMDYEAKRLYERKLKRFNSMAETGRRVLTERHKK